MGKVKIPERVTKSGLVQLLDDRIIERVPLHYCGGKWFGPNAAGGFSHYKDSHAAALLSEYEFSRKSGAAGETGNTPADRAMLWLTQNRSAYYAGPVAGWPAGLHQMGENRVLVTESVRLIQPKSGKWPTIQQLVQSLFHDPKHDQISVFLTWLSASLKALVRRLENPALPYSHCPAFCIFGERSSGKSALIDLIVKPLFGGRNGEPLRFLLEKKFNKDLFAAPLLVIDDKGASPNLEQRRQMGDEIKGLIWSEFVRMEGKGADALILKPFWRLIIAGNFEEASLNIAPALNESLRDKIIFCKSSRADGLPETEEEKAAWLNRIRAELPAFADFLLKYKTPRTLKRDARTGVVNFWHPEIEAALLEKQPECKAIEVIDLLGLANERDWHGTSTQFYSAIRELDRGNHYERLFPSIDKCGRILMELTRLLPQRITTTNPHNVRHYTISQKISGDEAGK